MNINEIAKMAGVSRAAVSRYLNDGYVSQEKKDKIKEVIEKTGYQPSSNARMLRTKKTKMIGVILPKINSQSISRMVAGISDVIDFCGYQLLLANTKNNTEEELKYFNVFRENHVDGIIFIATVLTKKHLKILKECDIPVVILGQRLHGQSCVYQDDYHAAKEMTEILLEKAANPVFIGVLEEDQAVGYNRKKGFMDAAAEKHISIDAGAMIQADFTIESGYEKMKELYQNNRNLDAVMCATESIAIGAMAYLKEIGKKIPADVRIAGMGESPISKVLSPRIASVYFSYKTSGSEAARMLIEEIDNPGNVKKELMMGYSLEISESVQ